MPNEGTTTAVDPPLEKASVPGHPSTEERVALGKAARAAAPGRPMKCGRRLRPDPTR